MTADGDAPLYDEFYFRHGCGLPYERSPHWLAFFGQIAERITKGIGPRTVLDAGCAIGLLVEALRERGVDAYGVDIAEYALAQVPEGLRPFCWQGSVIDPLPQRYDLIVCIEVLEHLPQGQAERAVANLCAFTDDVLFSSSPLDYREATHLTARPPEYWAGLFAEQGFVRDVDFDAGFIAAWATRFRRTREALPRLIAGYERRFWRLWQENSELRQQALETRRELAGLEQRLADAGTELAARQARLDQIAAGPGWQALQAIGPALSWLVPPNSRREQWARWAAGWLSRRARGGRRA
jgi:SAM-dependent methyltransferase